MADYKKILYDFWENIRVNNAADYKYGVDMTGYKKEAHISYIPDYNPMHMLNLYYPEDHVIGGGEMLPTIIVIHGGGWMYGVIDESERFLGYLASKGYAVMAMNYRLLQETDLQGQVSDIYHAIHWLEKYGPKRGFDLSRVLITGDSAGGHLSILTASIKENIPLQHKYGVTPFGFKLSAIAVSCPVAEVDKLYIAGSRYDDVGVGTAREYVRLMLGEMGEKAAYNGFMSASEVVEGINLPPVLIIGTEHDSLHEHTGYMIECLTSNHHKFETMIWPAGDGCHLCHVFNVAHPEWLESMQSNERMLEFFVRNM